MEVLTVVPDAPKSKMVLHCSIELLRLLIFRLFCLWSLTAVLYSVLLEMKRDSRYVDLNYQYLFPFLCAAVLKFVLSLSSENKCIALYSEIKPSVCALHLWFWQT